MFKLIAIQLESDTSIDIMGNERYGTPLYVALLNSSEEALGKMLATYANRGLIIGRIQDTPVPINI
jgi:hypothetical protein